MRLCWLPTTLAVCRLDASVPIPEWAVGGDFFAVVRTPHELSIVCADAAVPAAVRAERGWRAFGVQGTLDFSLTGVLLSLLQPLAAAGISVFAVSTFDTDHVLVKEDRMAAASAALRAAGHELDP